MLGSASGSFVFQIIPAVDQSARADNTQPQDRLERLCHDKAANLLTQVAGLFVASTTMFGALAQDAAETSSRIGRLQQRIDQLRSQVPHVEHVCSSDSLSLARNQRVEYKSSRTETSQLFNPGTMMQSVQKRHLANPPAPDFSALDQFRKDGKPCIMFYTYPQFFLDEWVREQEKEMADRKAKNAERRAERAAKQQRDVPKAAVKQVMKRVYDVDTGQLITVAASEPSNMTGVERKAPAANQSQNRASSTYTAQSFPAPPVPPASSTTTQSTFGAYQNAPRVSPRPSMPNSNSSLAAQSQNQGKNNFPPPPPLSSMQRAQPTAHARVSPRPVSSAPFSAPSPPTLEVNQPVAPAFVPPPAPAGPPPPAAPPPPAEGSLAAQLDAVKAQTSTAASSGGGGLLDQIANGVRLKKAAPQAERPAAETTTSGFNVAAILARRAALEMSDEESDSDWDD